MAGRIRHCCSGTATSGTKLFSSQWLSWKSSIVGDTGRSSISGGESKRAMSPGTQQEYSRDTQQRGDVTCFDLPSDGFQCPHRIINAHEVYS